MRFVLHITFLFNLCVFFSQAQIKKDTLQKVNLLKKKIESEFDIKNYKSDPHDRLIFELNQALY